MRYSKTILSLTATLAVARATMGATVAPEDPRRDATVRVIDQVMPSVVNIATETVVPVNDFREAYYRWFFRMQPADIMTSLGSGVVIDENGYLLTNDHVVRRARRIAVKFNTGTNVYEATLIASDPRRDVALLKLNAQPGEKFAAIRLAREDDLLLGETVLALGNPFGLGGSVSRGILSSKSRTLPEEGAQLDIPNWLQTDAPINPGNSGGPLINLRGELIGINVAVANLTPEGRPIQGIGFAIPIRLVQEALSDILPSDVVKSHWFGARVKVGSYPLVITSVHPESPAQRAGLRVDDTILQINGSVPRTIFEFSDLLTAKPSSDVNITVRREGQIRDVKVRLVPEDKVFNADMIRERLGMQLEVVRRGNRTGFLITDVERRSPASRAGLQANMVITAIDEQSPSDIKSFAKMMKDKPGGQRIQVTVQVPLRAGYWRIGTTELELR